MIRALRLSEETYYRVTIGNNMSVNILQGPCAIQSHFDRVNMDKTDRYRCNWQIGDGEVRQQSNSISLYHRGSSLEYCGSSNQLDLDINNLQQ